MEVFIIVPLVLSLLSVQFGATAAGTYGYTNYLSDYPPPQFYNHHPPQYFEDNYDSYYSNQIAPPEYPPLEYGPESYNFPPFDPYDPYTSSFPAAVEQQQPEGGTTNNDNNPPMISSEITPTTIQTSTDPPTTTSTTPSANGIYIILKNERNGRKRQKTRRRNNLEIVKYFVGYPTAAAPAAVTTTNPPPTTTAATPAPTTEVATTEQTLPADISSAVPLSYYSHYHHPTAVNHQSPHERNLLNPYYSYHQEPTVEPRSVIVAEEERGGGGRDYSFGYQVNSHETQDFKRAEETREGEIVSGLYSFLQPDGITRTVTYMAHPIHGFNAVVHNYLQEGPPQHHHQHPIP